MYPKMNSDEFTAGFRPGIDIMGRPDHNCVLPLAEQFWHKRAKSSLPYVHSIGANSCLIHKVAYVDIHWYSGHYSYMQRLDKPFVLVHTVCQFSVSLTGRMAGKVCELPDPNAILCGRCHGELPTFSPQRKIKIKKQWAKDHLGCRGVVEVLGPYQYSGGNK